MIWYDDDIDDDDEVDNNDDDDYDDYDDDYSCNSVNFQAMAFKFCVKVDLDNT